MAKQRAAGSEHAFRQERTHARTPLETIHHRHTEGGWGGGGEQREQWADPLATQPEGKNELSQTSRSVQGACVGGGPHVQSKISRALHAHRAKKLLQDLRNLDKTTIKRAKVRCRGAREKGAMAFVECLGVSQEGTTEGPLWRKTLGRSLGSHDLARLAGGINHGNDCR